MRRLITLGFSLLAAPGISLADGVSLAGSLWQCSRASDSSQFVIAFHPGNGVGGGEIRDGKVMPYVFDASRVKPGNWPGHWEVKGSDFKWSFPDQHMEIDGTISSSALPGSRLSGFLVAAKDRIPISCRSIPKLPEFGDGYVVPRDGHFIDPDDDEAELKVPAGISLPEPRRGR